MYEYYIYVNGNLEDYTNDYEEAREMYHNAVDEYIEGTNVELVCGEDDTVIMSSSDDDDIQVVKSSLDEENEDY